MIVLGVPSAAAREVTLADCRALALAGNADLAKAAREIDAAEAAWKRARAFLNPELSVESEDFGGDLPRWSESQTTFGLSQRIEPPGVRSARMDAASHGRALASGELDRATRDLLCEVDRRFAILLAAQTRAEVLQENVRTGDSLLAAVIALVAAGEVSPIEADRARADRSLAEIEALGASAEERSKQAALAALWCTERPESIRAVASFEGEIPLPARTFAIALPLPSPEAKSADAEAEMLKAAARIERRTRFPSLGLSAGVRRYAATGEKTFAASASLSLPVFDRNGAAIEEAEVRIEQARFDRRSVEARVRQARVVAYEGLQAALAEAEMLRRTVIPDIGRSYEAIHEGYRLGKFRLIDVLDAKRARADAKLRYVSALESAAIARADLEQSLGWSLKETGEGLR